jgi:hypothetical protein
LGLERIELRELLHSTIQIRTVRMHLQKQRVSIPFTRFGFSTVQTSSPKLPAHHRHTDEDTRSCATSALRHTSPTPEPATTAPTRCRQTGSADGQSVVTTQVTGGLVLRGRQSRVSLLVNRPRSRFYGHLLKTQINLNRSMSALGCWQQSKR